MTDQVRIRMYRQGLGDCFLLSIRTNGSDVHILIDCGVLKGTSGAADSMRKVARSIRDTTGGRLDVLVVTHEHWDHVSGFLQAEDIFNQLTVGEVWVGWTEKEDDDLAIELRNRKERILRSVASAADQVRKMSSLGARRMTRRLDGLMQFFGDLGVDGRPTTSKAMTWAKTRPQAAIQHLYPSKDPFILPGASGIRVYVLGPPYDRGRIRRSRPTKTGAEVYELAAAGDSEAGFLAAVDAVSDPGASTGNPFEGWFAIPDEASKQQAFFAEHYWDAGLDWCGIEDDWLHAAGQLALQLDSHTNNTSLVLAFELPGSQRVLLFPGDAQVGNWLSWGDLSWTFDDGGRARTVTGESLLGRTVFYKVGHHGSHNATLRERGLELMMSDELVAMIPVNRQMATAMEWNMPFPPLLHRLQQKTRGRILDSDTGLPAANPGLIGEAPWQDFVARTDVTEDWIDYRIPL
jgi:hypothetical protein